MKKRVLASQLLLALAVAGCGDPLVTPVEPVAGPGAAAHDHGPPALSPGGATADQNQLYAAIRAATARYQQVDRALEAGYVVGSECVESPAGGMGYHYIRPDLIDGVLEPTMPEVLVYEPQKNGRLRLVAVEHIVVAALWNGGDPPALGNRVFDDHTPPGSAGPPFPHYQLHSWLWKHNPAGIHTAYNPRVGCAFAEAH